MELHLYFLLGLVALACAESSTTEQSITSIKPRRHMDTLNCLVDTITQQISANSKNTKDFIKRFAPEGKIAEALDEVDARYENLTESLKTTFQQIIRERKACERAAEETLRPKFCLTRARAAFFFRTTKTIGEFTGDLTKIIAKTIIRYDSENVILNTLRFVKVSAQQLLQTMKHGASCVI